MSPTGTSAALVAALLTLSVAVAACGKKGALYLPEPARPAKTDQAAPNGAPPAPVEPGQDP
jgi:predicted small lipoprotein YifL